MCSTRFVVKPFKLTSKKKYSLLGTVYELVLVGPFKAGLHTFIIPKLFSMLEKFLFKDRGGKKSYIKKMKLHSFQTNSNKITNFNKGINVNCTYSLT